MTTYDQMTAALWRAGVAVAEPPALKDALNVEFYALPRKHWTPGHIKAHPRAGGGKWANKADTSGQKSLFDESKHPREPAGKSEGGQFAEKESGSGGEGKEKPTKTADSIPLAEVRGQSREPKAENTTGEKQPPALSKAVTVERRGAIGRRPSSAGDFFTLEGESTPEYGDQIVQATIKAGTRIYSGTSSMDFAEANGLLDRPDQEVEKVTGYPTLHALQDAWDASEIDDQNLAYDAFQIVARRELQRQGYQGAYWSEEEDLTPQQYQIWDRSAIEQPAPTSSTDTPAFKAWFGNSKVVDEKGKPLCVYHGTPKGDFQEFDPKLRGTRTRSPDAKHGFYFHADPELADAYTNWGGGVESAQGSAVLPVYLSIQNPLYHYARKAITASIIQKAIKDGYDGIISKTQDAATPFELVVFHPTQIKSATGNRGTFAPENPDIRYSLTSALQREMYRRGWPERYKWNPNAGVQQGFGFRHGPWTSEDEQKHPRGGEGTREGGKFVAKGAAGTPVAEKPPKQAAKQPQARKPRQKKPTDPGDHFRVKIGPRTYDIRRHEGKWFSRVAGLEEAGIGWDAVPQRLVAPLTKRVTEHNKARLLQALDQAAPISGKRLEKQLGMPKDDYLDAFFALSKEGKIWQNRKNGQINVGTAPAEAPRKPKQTGKHWWKKPGEDAAAEKAEREAGPQRLADTAERFGVWPNLLQTRAQEVLDSHMEWAKTRKAAKETATKMTGLTATSANAMEDKGLDYASVREFDEIAEEIAHEFPGVIGNFQWGQSADVSTQELSDNLWALLTERKERLPDIYDQNILTEAAKSLGPESSTESQEAGEEVPEDEMVPFRRPGPIVRYSLAAALRAEYAARAVHRRNVERYRRMMAKYHAERYASVWDESKHPRGQPENKGQFVDHEKAHALGKEHGSKGSFVSKKEQTELLRKSGLDPSLHTEAFRGGYEEGTSIYRAFQQEQERRRIAPFLDEAAEILGYDAAERPDHTDEIEEYATRLADEIEEAKEAETNAKEQEERDYAHWRARKDAYEDAIQRIEDLTGGTTPEIGIEWDADVNTAASGSVYIDIMRESADESQGVDHIIVRISDHYAPAGAGFDQASQGYHEIPDVNLVWEEGQPLDIAPVAYALAHYEETKANTEKEEREARRERRGL